MIDGPDSDDELDAAYARAHALADEGRGPSAAVRANVLAAAREVAAQAKAGDAAAPPLVPVASPVTAVGRGRALAINLSSWRVRAGAAVCAALLVALGAWRLDAGHRFDGNLQVATASLELAKPPTAALPRDLPAPGLSIASAPYASPPPIVEDPVERTPGGTNVAAKAAARDKDRDVIVAQAEQSERAPRPAPPPDLRAEARRSAAPPAALDAAAPAPVAMAPVAPTAQAPAQAESPTTVVIAASAAPTQVATLPPMPPSVVARRVAVAPAPRPAEMSGVGMPGTAAAAPSSLAEANRTRAAAVDGAGATLQSAADRGDVEALKALLAEPAARVDAPDAAGRTALLHAVLAQRAAAVRLLIAAGADPGRADHEGLTPRAAAQAGANAEIAGLLAAPH